MFQEWKADSFLLVSIFFSSQHLIINLSIFHQASNNVKEAGRYLANILLVYI